MSKLQTDIIVVAAGAAGTYIWTHGNLVDAAVFIRLVLLTGFQSSFN